MGRTTTSTTYLSILVHFFTMILIRQRFSSAFRCTLSSSASASTSSAQRRIGQGGGSAAAAAVVVDDDMNTATTNAAVTRRRQQRQPPPSPSQVALPRPAFRMPSNAANDAATSTTSSSSSLSSSLSLSATRKTTTTPIIKSSSSFSSSSTSTTTTTTSWNALGLWTELVEILTNELDLHGPTTVQQLVLPELLQEKAFHHVAFLAATGSGKTLAYALPLMQRLKQQEVFPITPTTTIMANGDATTTNTTTMVSARPKHRPRGLILVPTRELALQIKNVVKSLSHGIKLSVQILTGGGTGTDSYSKQRKYLEHSPVDIIVATPGRLLQHVQDQTVILNNKHLKFVVLDEMDTMLEQGFANDLASLLYPVLYHKRTGGGGTTKNGSPLVIDPVKDLVADGPSVWLTSATMTQAVQKMMGDDTVHDNTIQARRHYVKKNDPVTTNNNNNNRDGGGKEPERRLPQIKLVLPKMKVLRAAGLHKVVPTLNQVFVDVGNQDKLALLLQYVDKQQQQGPNDDDDDGRMATTQSPLRQQRRHQTMIFCNTASACRAVEYALKEAGHVDCRSYHGDLNSAARAANLAAFRTQTDGGLLVCTDLAARGLDVPTVDHVLMFDFPLNALDYLHRSGRTARGIQNDNRNNKDTTKTTKRRESTVTAFITKRDVVLAMAIEAAVKNGAPIDGLSSRKSDYQLGGRLHAIAGTTTTRGGGGRGPKQQQQLRQQPREQRSRAGYSSRGSRTATGPSPSSVRRTGPSPSSRGGGSSSASSTASFRRDSPSTSNRDGSSSAARRTTKTSSRTGGSSSSFGRGPSSSSPVGRSGSSTRGTTAPNSKRRGTADQRR